jgi:hypothetical protein
VHQGERATGIEPAFRLPETQRAQR